jgi:hypothetical protein
MPTDEVGMSWVQCDGDDGEVRGLGGSAAMAQPGHTTARARRMRNIFSRCNARALLLVYIILQND